MNQSFEQSEQWQPLIKLLKLGQTTPAFQPILWVGAGLSVAAGYPTTNQLIEKLRALSLEGLPDFDPSVPTFELDAPESSFTHWVQCFAEKNGYGHLNRALASIFTPLSNEPTVTHKMLINLPFKTLFTTNYDELLETALVQTKTPYNLITHENNMGLEQAGTISLYKIHGSMNNINDWTLDEKSYLNFADQYPFLDGKLKNVLFSHSIVFIGCSMADPRLLDWYRLCKKQKKLNQLANSFVIIREKAWLELSDEHRTLYQEARVQPLFYNSHDELPTLVETLTMAINTPDKKETPEAIMTAPDPAVLLEHEEQQLDELLYEMLAPRIIQAIANIWLECKQGVCYLTELKIISGIKTQRKGRLAFDSLEDSFVELSKKRIGIKTKFTIKKQVFQAVASQLEQFSPTHDALELANFDPHALYGKWIIDHTPAEMAQANKDIKTLYKKILKETCELIVDCSQALPSWTKDNLIKQLEKPTELFEQLHKELKHWQKTKAESKDATTQLEDEYRRAVARRFDQLQIFGISFGKNARKYQLSVAYISLTTKTDYNNAVSGEILSTEEALTRFKRLVILGEAGQGKTTLLQWLTVQCGRKSFIGNKSSWNQKVPVLIKLREVLNSDGLPSPTDFYALMIKNIPVKQPHQDWFKGILTDGKAILMIDGFDEVPATQRDEVLEWVNTLCQNHTGNQIILTSRPAAYTEAALASQNFQVIQLQTMDHHAQQDFIEHWHQAIALEYDKTQPNALTHQAKSLLQRLNQQRTLSNLAENPLLCGVICLLHHDRSSYLPKDRTDLYEASCRMLADSRDREKQVLEADEFKALDYRDKQLLLTDVAQWMSKNEQTSLSPKQLVNRFELKLNNLPNLSKKLTAPALKYFFLERSGLLLKVGATEIQFAHRSFQEFFTAKYIVQERDWMYLRQNATNNYWHETIQLAVGLCQSKTENEAFLTHLLKQANQFATQQHNKNATLLYLLVLRCRETMREISPTFANQLESIIPKVVPPTSSIMVDALAGAGELALPYLKRTKEQTEQAGFYCMQVLLKIETSEAYQLLKDYLKFNKSVDINRLCLVITQMNADLAKTTDLPGLMIADGLTGFPRAITRKLAFLMQDSRLMQTDTTTILTLDNFDDWELSQGLVPLAAFNQLKTLDLDSSQIKNLMPLAGLIQLQTACLSNTQINDLAPLARLTRLRSLSLTNTKINDLAPLTVLTQLRALYLPNTQITTLKPLEKLKKLQELHLYNTQINDLTPLAGLTQLQILGLRDTKINDLTPLAALTQLKTLGLRNTKINDLTPLAGLSQLHTLYLHNTLVSNLEPLAQLTQLQKLDLRNTQINDLTPLAALTELQILDLRNTQVNDLSTLAKLSQLQIVRISGVNAIDISFFQKQLPNCKVVK